MTRYTPYAPAVIDGQRRDEAFTPRQRATLNRQCDQVGGKNPGKSGAVGFTRERRQRTQPVGDQQPFGQSAIDRPGMSPACS